MAYFLGFALLIAGYTLVDWGHYYVQHRPASMWWLVSGKGTPPPDIPKSSASTGTPPPGVFGIPGLKPPVNPGTLA